MEGICLCMAYRSVLRNDVRCKLVFSLPQQSFQDFCLQLTTVKEVKTF